MNRCFIIAEAGVNHNGDINLAKQLVLAAKEAGADAVKFQTFRAKDLVAPNTPTAAYQQAQTGTTSQFELLKNLELDLMQFKEIAEYCKEIDIEFMSTAFDELSLDFLIQLGIKRLKVPSGEITNTPLLTYLAKTGLPLIISTGMCTLDEVKTAVNTVMAAQQIPAEINLLHCTSNYPTRWEDVNLRAMQTLATEFNLSVGYSDHTQGTLIPCLAVCLGATIIEKHFTLDKTLPGPDHMASLEPVELKAMIMNIRITEDAMGSPIKNPTENELPVRELVRRSITLNKNLHKDAVIQKEDLIMLRPGHGIQPCDLDKIIGKQLKKDADAYTTLEWEHLE